MAIVLVRSAMRLTPDEVDLLVNGAQEYLQPEGLAEAEPIEEGEDNGTERDED